MKKDEEIIGVATAFSSASSTVVVIPSQLKVEAGTKFVVKRDETGRIVYEPLMEASG